MSNNKTHFSDGEILSYGRQQGFFENEGLCLLRHDYYNNNENNLLNLTLKNLNFKKIADYVAASFMNPKTAVKIFAGINNEFLRFRTALPNTNIANAAYALLFSVGNQSSYLGYENKETIHEMLLELSGANNYGEISPITIEISPVCLLVILAAGDVILQNKYEGGWFTAASLLNAYDISEDRDFNRVCSPIADVASDIVYSSTFQEDIQNALEEMVNEEILYSDEVDGTSVYSFTLEYRYLPKLFVANQNRLAACKYYENGNISIFYVISNPNEAWSFTIKKDVGKIERLNALSFKKLFQTVLAT